MTTDTPRPRATYRLQLNHQFTFADAEALAPYLQRLGISHAYLSPILTARRGSMHGYDVVDHTRINPELGTLDDFRRMASRFRVHGIGIILDIVPNHMGIGGDENDLWLDVLKWGKQSRYADWFDISWSPSEPSLADRVLVPFLGSSYGEALADGRLPLRFDAESGSFAVWAEETHKLPICPTTYRPILPSDGDLGVLGNRFAEAIAAEAAAPLEAELARLAGDASIRRAIDAAVEAINTEPSHDALDRLIRAQHWRPAHHAVAANDINYRRFFIVSDLAAIRVERPEVFEHVHKLTFQLVGEGLAEGLRVDHIDGLYDPKAYCLKLREAAPRPIYLVVEKILAPHEQLPHGWNVQGTTGYEFATAVTQLLVDPAGEAPLTAAYEAFTGNRTPFHVIERAAKLEIMDFGMAAELDSLTSRLHRLAANNRMTQDVTRNAIRSGLRQVIASLSVYRTYVDGGEVSDQDRRNVAVAVAEARHACRHLGPQVFDFLSATMTGSLGEGFDPAVAIDAARRIQQFTGPVMAKGLEDTALYRQSRLIAVNDVGSHPDRFSRGVASFHDASRARLEREPDAMLTTSSHDTKRGEDVRMRIATISGLPLDWAETVTVIARLLAGQGVPPIDPDDLWYVLQLMLGSWPTTLGGEGEPDLDELDRYRERLEAAVVKSLREARVRTSWDAPEEAYEAAVLASIRRVLAPGAPLNAFLAFERRVGWFGASNGLALAALKLTVPGVPDVYRGAEVWEQSLVDPDNRRPLDFPALTAALDTAAPPHWPTLMADWRSGRVKRRLIADILRCRREHPDLFARGSYEPIDLGDAPVCAFLRRLGDAALLVAVRLHPWRELPARLDLPEDVARRSWMVVVGQHPAISRAIDLGRMLADVPVTVLLGQ